MKTPVVIPARREADVIGRTLEHLPTDVEPIVIVNGPGDQTAEIAASYGATVLSSREGKVLAFKAALHYLGDRALEPLLMTDGDCYPASKMWPRIMLRAATRNYDNPYIASGPVAFTSQRGLFDDTARTSRVYLRLWQRKLRGTSVPCGANSVLHIKTPEMLGHVLDMPHYWPGEDVALRDLIVTDGGKEGQIVNPFAAIVTDGQRHRPIISRITRGAEDNHEHLMATYAADAAPESVPYPA